MILFLLPLIFFPEFPTTTYLSSEHWNLPIKPCKRRLNLQQSTLMYWMSSMSCTSTLSSEQMVSSCNLQGSRQTEHQRDQIHSFLHLITRGFMYLVEMRLKTALKLLQLRENRTPQAELLNSAACWFPSRYVWMKWQISGNNCLTSIVSSRCMLSFGCWRDKGSL